MRVRIRLIRKLAEVLNGVDLSKVRVGDCFELPDSHARILMAEGWAELVDTTAEDPDGKPKKPC